MIRLTTRTHVSSKSGFHKVFRVETAAQSLPSEPAAQSLASGPAIDGSIVSATGALSSVLEDDCSLRPSLFEDAGKGCLEKICPSISQSCPTIGANHTKVLPSCFSFSPLSFFEWISPLSNYSVLSASLTFLFP